MFSRYFRDLQDSLTKTYASAGKLPAARKAGAANKEMMYEDFRAALEGMIPPRLALGRVAIRDRSGYAPDMADFTAYTMISRNTAAIFGGVIPFEIARASYHLVPSLDRKTLFESLLRVAHVKKCD